MSDEYSGSDSGELFQLAEEIFGGTGKPRDWKGHPELRSREVGERWE